ncbi:ABC transporter substrate-binding protein [Kineococcus gynurae]|uniref:ABC transporter substrate-binding protein n=1 Tax=Kineococcus gynurae TaxID=452979 RepID=A0ABV5LP60_9ACTN
MTELPRPSDGPPASVPPLRAPALRNPLTRRTLLAGGTGLGLGALAACAGPTGTPGPNTLTLALNRSLVSLDNKVNQFDAAITVQRAVRQALTTIGPDVKPRLVLAESFEATGATEWTVRLRPEACYSDGSPVTVEDVATALRMYAETDASFVASFFPEIPEVEATGPTSFVLRTERPLPTLDALMSNILISPAAANEPAELQEGVGSGPYVMAAHDRGTGRYQLQRNPNYWSTPAVVERVDVRFQPEENSRVIAIRSGEVDVIDTLTPDAAQQLRGLSGIELMETQSLRLNQIFYNFRKPAGHPLADPRGRQALSMAIDGRALVEEVLSGTAVQAEGVVTSNQDGYVKTGEYVYDPGAARKMLDSLNARDLAVTIIWESGEFPGDTFVMEALVEMLGDIGVRAQLREFQPGGDIMSWRQGRAGDWDLLGNGFPGPTGQAVVMLQGMYAGTAEKESTRDTYQGYVVPAVTDLITAAAAEPDPTLRATLTAEAQQAVWDTWPAAWQFNPKAILAHRSRVAGIELSPANNYPLAAVDLRS